MDDAPFATKFVIVSDPEALEPERWNSMDKLLTAAMLSGSIPPPKSSMSNDIKPDPTEIVCHPVIGVTASAKKMRHWRSPVRSET